MYKNMDLLFKTRPETGAPFFCDLLVFFEGLGMLYNPDFRGGSKFVIAQVHSLVPAGSCFLLGVSRCGAVWFMKWKTFKSCGYIQSGILWSRIWDLALVMKVSNSLEACWKAWICLQCSLEQNVSFLESMNLSAMFTCAKCLNFGKMSAMFTWAKCLHFGSSVFDLWDHWLKNKLSLISPRSFSASCLLQQQLRLPWPPLFFS